MRRSGADHRSPGRPVRVGLVDDHAGLRECLGVYLRLFAGFAVVGEASSGAEALRLVGAHVPDVLVLDLRLPDTSGVDVARRVRRQWPAVRILIYTAYGVDEERTSIRALVRLGVSGYVHKRASFRELVQVIRTVAAGQTVLSHDALAAALDGGGELLTAREDEVLRLLTAGRRNAEIARALHISPKTVEFHVSNVLDKLGVRSRVEAVVEAQRRGAS